MEDSISVTHPNAAKLIAYRENGKIVVDGREIEEKVFLQNVKEGNPDILQDVIDALDRNITPYNVTRGSEKKLVCLKQFENCNGKICDVVWVTSASNMTKHKNTYQNTITSVWIGYNDLATTEPEISDSIAYLDGEYVVMAKEKKRKEDFLELVRNGNPKILQKVIEVLESGVTPYNITSSSHKKVVCFKDVEKENGETVRMVWVSTVYGTKRNGCTYISRSPRDIWIGYNDLATTHPEIAEQWDYEKNFPLTPKDVSYGSRNKVWWKIDYYDEVTQETYHYGWKASLNGRTGMGTGCPNINSSKMEQAAYKILNKLGIDFKVEKAFKDCKYKGMLRFDIYIPSLKIMIELDGIQHFQPINFFGGEEGYIDTKKRDAIKDRYCKKKGISLLRIPYIYDTDNNFDKIEKLITDFLENKKINKDIINFYKIQDNKSYMKAFAA